MFCGSLVFFGQVFFHDEVVDAEALSFHGVLSPVVFQQFGHLVAFVQRDLFQSDVGSYEMPELIEELLPEEAIRVEIKEMEEGERLVHSS